MLQKSMKLYFSVPEPTKIQSTTNPKQHQSTIENQNLQ